MIGGAQRTPDGMPYVRTWWNIFHSQTCQSTSVRSEEQWCQVPNYGWLNKMVGLW